MRSDNIEYDAITVEGYLRIMFNANKVEFDFDRPLVWCNDIIFSKVYEVEKDLGIKPERISESEGQIKITFEGLEDRGGE